MKNLTCLQAYRAMLHCFRIIYLQTQDEYLGDLLSGAALYSANKNESPQTMDPAVWHDWMDGVKIVMNDDSATYDSAELTIEQGYAAARQYFIIYCDIGYFESIGILRDLLGQDVNHSDLAKWLRNTWEQSLQVVLQEKLPEKIGHFFTGDTGLLERESFTVMKIFLDDWCQNNPNELLIQLVQNCRLKQKDNYWSAIPDILEPQMWQIWKDSVAQVLNDSSVLTIDVAYRAMPIFLQKNFNQNIDSEILNLIQGFNVDGHERLIQRPLGFLWLSAASKTNAEQEAMVYEVITINTSIQKNIAEKVITSWFEQYRDIVDQRVIFTSLFINELWDKSFKILNQHRRSYLLLDDEITVLELYFIMVKFLKLMKQEQPQFDIEKDYRPKNFLVLLKWIFLIEKSV